VSLKPGGQGRAPVRPPPLLRESGRIGNPRNVGEGLTLIPGPVSTNAAVGELQRTWNRPDAAEFGALYGAFSPNYQTAMESFQKAQEALKPEKK